MRTIAVRPEKREEEAVQTHKFWEAFQVTVESSIQPRHGRQSRSLPDAVQLLKNVRRASSA